MQEKFIESLAEVIRLSLEKGMKFPLHLTAVGMNSNVIVGRYTKVDPDSIKCEILTAECFDEDEFKMPINIMLMDATGAAARLIVQATMSGFVIH